MAEKKTQNLLYKSKSENESGGNIVGWLTKFQSENANENEHLWTILNCEYIFNRLWIKV